MTHTEALARLKSLWDSKMHDMERNHHAGHELSREDYLDMTALAYAAQWGKQIDVLRNIASLQAKDAGLWFRAETAPEAYLQRTLRKLHGIIEGEQS